jgi:hypothetical protein
VTYEPTMRRCDAVPREVRAGAPCPRAAVCRMGLVGDRCAIQVADENPDGLQLERIATLLGGAERDEGLSRERIRQIEVIALAKFERAAARQRLPLLDFAEHARP